MRRGLPMVIWSLQESPPGAFFDALQAFVGTSGISGLPDRVRRSAWMPCCSPPESVAVISGNTLRCYGMILAYGRNGNP